MKNYRNWGKAGISALLCLSLFACNAKQTTTEAQPTAAAQEQVTATEAPAAAAEPETASAEVVLPERSNLENYELEKVVVFSRHNMRAPTKTAAALMDQLTPNQWTDYTAPNGELTLLGGVQETAMGQYFRKYLTSKGLMEEDWIPEDGQVRVYANSYERTIATANYFTAGMFPAANVEVEYHEDVGTMDPVFKPCLNFISDAYLEQVQEELDSLADGKGIQGMLEAHADDLATLEYALDFSESSYAKENNVTSIPVDDSQITYELGEEPTPSGGLKVANSAADALMMQYYVESDLNKADFGHNLTWDQWQQIGNLSSMYLDITFGLPSVAVNVTNPLLKELKSELTNDDRVFSFLCGHDSNILPLMVVLGVEDYTAEYNLSTSSPIGCKMVWEKYRGTDGEDYAVFSLVYQTSEKLRENELVTLDNPPVWMELSFSGLEKNADGLYRWDDVMARFDEAIAAFDDLPTDEAAAA